MNFKILNSKPKSFSAFLCLLSVFLMWSYPADAAYITSSGSQWSVNGPSLYYDGGNVGVGTTAPGVKLDVNGDFRINGDITLGGAGKKIMAVNSATFSLPLQGTKAAFLNIAINSMCKVYMSSSENGFYQPTELYITRQLGAPVIIRDGIKIHDHSYDVGFSSDVNGDVWMEKILYSTGRPINITQVNQLKGTCTVLNGSTTIAGSGIDQSVISHNLFGINGTSIYYNSGNIGIGTTAPSLKLTVNGGTGDVINVGGGQVAGLNSTQINADQAVSLGYLQANYGANTSQLWNGTKNGNIWNGDAGLGNVGIGTTNPARQLNVYGTAGDTRIRVTETATTGYGVFEFYNNVGLSGAFFQLGSTASGYGGANSFNMYNILNAPLVLGTNNTERMRIDGNGNVGIGNTSPAQKLHVTGNIFTTGNLFMNTVSGSTGIGWYMPSYYTWYDYMKSGGGVGPNGLGAPTDGASGVTGWARRFNIEANTNFGWIFESGGNSTSSAATVKFAINAATGAFHSTGNGIIDGNVGIGTTAPSLKLTVNGGTGDVINVGGGQVAGLNSTQINADQAVSLGYLQANYGANTSQLWNGTKNGNIWNGDAGLGNVGIGTTNPGSKLEVAGDVLVGNANYIFGKNAAGSSSRMLGINATNDVYIGSVDQALAGLNLLSGPSEYILTYNSGTDTLKLKTGNSDRVTIDSAGNVGIGTTTPAYKVHVAGGTMQVGDGAWPTTTLGTSGQRLGLISDGTVDAIFNSVNMSNTIAADKGAMFRFGARGTTGALNAAFVEIAGMRETAISGNLSAYMQFKTMSSVGAQVNVMRIDSAGNVGIGTTTPLNKLTFAANTVETIDVGGGFIHGLNSTPITADQAVPLGYLQANYGSTASELWKGTKNGNIWNGDLGLGNVGIGVTNPVTPLHISKLLPTAQTEFRIENTSTTGYGNGITFYSGNTNVAERNWAFFQDGITYGDWGISQSNSIGGNPYSAGTYRIYINPTGNVGIGATVPRSKLEVTSGAANINADAAGVVANFTGANQTGQSSTVSLETNDAVAADIGGILGFGGRYLGSSYANWASIKGLKADATSGNYGGYLSFFTRLTGAGSVERMRIDTNGNVGIGTSNPGYKLDVSGNANILGDFTLQGNMRGNVLSSNRNVFGLERNILFNAPARYTVTQSGPASISLSTIFDGYFSPTYSGSAPSIGNPQVITISGLPEIHTQAGAWVGWTTRYWPPINFKIEGYDTYSGYNNWRTIADYSSTPYSGADFMVPIPVGGQYTQLRYTVYTAGGTNGNFGFSELFFIEPEATRPYAGFLPSSMYEGANSNVGIGIANPSTKLTVSNGTGDVINVGGGQVAGLNSTQINADQAVSLGYLQANYGANTSELWKGTKNGNIWNGDAGVGTVGVGTTNPAGTKLFIDSDQGTTNNAALKIVYQGATTVLGEVAALAHRNNQWNGLYVNGTGSSLTNAVFVEGNKPVILNAGNVGIGTTNPLVKLDISGGAFIRGAGTIINNAGAGELQIGYALGASGTVGSVSRLALQPYGHTGGPWKFIARDSASIAYLDIDYGTAHGLTLDSSGKVGIGKTNPSVRLDVANDISASGSISAGTNLCLGADCISTWNNFIKVNTAPTLSGLTLTGILTMSGSGAAADIKGVNKLTVAVIDPLYSINGTKYSTYAASISGGLKEEYVGKTNIKSKNKLTGEFEKIIDFNNIEEGSDLWVWRKVIKFNKESVEVAVTPYGQLAQVYYLIDGNKLIFRSDKEVEISYRLIARRFDWMDWPTLAADQSEKTSLIIND